MKYEYRSSAKTEWAHFRQVWRYAATFAIATAILFFTGDSTSDFFWDLLAVISAFFLAGFIPYAAIHFRFESVSKSIVMVYDDEAKSIEIRDNHDRSISRFQLSEIRLVRHVMTRGFRSGDTGRFPWSHYNFAEINLRNGEKYIVTSMLIERWNLVGDERYEVVETWFPYPAPPK